MAKKENISSFQLICMTAGFIQASNVLLVYSSQVAGRDLWLAILTALVISIPFILAYISLARTFPGRSFGQISEAIYGVFVGRIISIIYTIIFFLLIVFNLRFFGDFFKTFIFVETPLWAIISILIMLSVWAVLAGIEVIARCSCILIVYVLIMQVITVGLLLKDLDFANFLPILDLAPGDFLRSVQIVLTLHFLEVMVFLMIFPHMNQVKRLGKSFLLGFSLGAVTLLIYEVRNIAVMGNVSDILISPSFATVRYISVADVLTRLELIVALVIIITMFLKISLLLYSVVSGMAWTMALHSYLPLVFPAGIIAVVLVLTVVESTVEQVYLATSFWPVLIFPFQLFPIFSLFIAKIKKARKR